MASTLKDHSLSATYDASNKKFTIHNTSGIDKEIIEKIFSDYSSLRKTEMVIGHSLKYSGSRDAIAEVEN